jgi:signal transduction histidine kinase
MMQLLQQKLEAHQQSLQTQKDQEEINRSCESLSSSNIGSRTIRADSDANTNAGGAPVVPSVPSKPTRSTSNSSHTSMGAVVMNMNDPDSSPRISPRAPPPMSETHHKKDRTHNSHQNNNKFGAPEIKNFEKIPGCLMSGNRRKFFSRLVGLNVGVSAVTWIINYCVITWYAVSLDSSVSNYLHVGFIGMFLVSCAQQLFQLYSTAPTITYASSSGASTIVSSSSSMPSASYGSSDKLGVQNAAAISLFVSGMSILTGLANIILTSRSPGNTTCDRTSELRTLHTMYLGISSTFLPFVAIIISALGNTNYMEPDNVKLLGGISASLVCSYCFVLILPAAWPVVYKAPLLVVQLTIMYLVLQTIREFINKEATSTNEQDALHIASHNETYYYHYLLLFSSRKKIISTWLLGSWCAHMGINVVLFTLENVTVLGRLIPVWVLFVCICTFSMLCRLVFSYICATYGYELGHSSIYELEAHNAAHVDRRAFLRYVFHEVRVPLNSISLGLELLAESEKIVNDDKETVVMMREAITFMGETLNDVLAIQKVEEGALKLIFKPFDINDLLNISVQPYLEISQSKRLNIISTINSDVCRTVIGDKYRLKHVLMNIISNAVKYSYPDCEVQIIVADEGPVSKIAESVQTAIARMSAMNSSSPRSSSSHTSASSSESVTNSMGMFSSSPASSGKEPPISAFSGSTKTPNGNANSSQSVPAMSNFPLGTEIPSPAASGKDVNHKFAFTPRDAAMIPASMSMDISTNTLMDALNAETPQQTKASASSSASANSTPSQSNSNVSGNSAASSGSATSSSKSDSNKSDGSNNKAKSPRSIDPNATTTREYRHFTISIVDSGCGIDETNIDSLFNPFLSTKPGELKKGRGSGIGLAICKEIMKLHGGNISCTSVKGVGSTFIIHVPLEIVNVKSAFYNVKSALKPSINEVSFMICIRIVVGCLIDLFICVQINKLGRLRTGIEAMQASKHEVIFSPPPSIGASDSKKKRAEQMLPPHQLNQQQLRSTGLFESASNSGKSSVYVSSTVSFDSAKSSLDQLHPRQSRSQSSEQPQPPSTGLFSPGASLDHTDAQQHRNRGNSVPSMNSLQRNMNNNNANLNLNFNASSNASVGASSNANVKLKFPAGAGAGADSSVADSSSMFTRAGSDDDFSSDASDEGDDRQKRKNRMRDDIKQGSRSRGQPIHPCNDSKDTLTTHNSCSKSNSGNSDDYLSSMSAETLANSVSSVSASVSMLGYIRSRSQSTDQYHHPSYLSSSADSPGATISAAAPLNLIPSKSLSADLYDNRNKPSSNSAENNRSSPRAASPSTLSRMSIEELVRHVPSKDSKDSRDERDRAANAANAVGVYGTSGKAISGKMSMNRSISLNHQQVTYLSTHGVPGVGVGSSIQAAKRGGHQYSSPSSSMSSSASTSPNALFTAPPLVPPMGSAFGLQLPTTPPPTSQHKQYSGAENEDEHVNEPHGGDSLNIHAVVDAIEVDTSVERVIPTLSTDSVDSFYNRSANSSRDSNCPSSRGNSPSVPVFEAANYSNRRRSSSGGSSGGGAGGESRSGSQDFTHTSAVDSEPGIVGRVSSSSISLLADNEENSAFAADQTMPVLGVNLVINSSNSGMLLGNIGRTSSGSNSSNTPSRLPASSGIAMTDDDAHSQQRLQHHHQQQHYQHIVSPSVVHADSNSGKSIATSVSSDRSSSKSPGSTKKDTPPPFAVTQKLHPTPPPPAISPSAGNSPQHRMHHQIADSGVVCNAVHASTPPPAGVFADAGVNTASTHSNTSAASSSVSTPSSTATAGATNNDGAPPAAAAGGRSRPTSINASPRSPWVGRRSTRTHSARLDNILASCDNLATAVVKAQLNILIVDGKGFELCEMYSRWFCSYGFCCLQMCCPIGSC